jgi:hypothetical protein
MASIPFEYINRKKNINMLLFSFFVWSLIGSTIVYVRTQYQAKNSNIIMVIFNTLLYMSIFMISQMVVYLSFAPIKIIFILGLMISYHLQYLKLDIPFTSVFMAITYSMTQLVSDLYTYYVIKLLRTYSGGKILVLIISSINLLIMISYILIFIWK